MINRFKKTYSTCRDFLKQYNELWLGPLAILLFVISRPIVTSIDPQAVPYTLDAFQKILFGHAVFFLCTFTAMLMIRLTFPGIFRYLVNEFDTQFSNLTNNSCDKLRFSLSVLALYLLGLILCMLVL